MYRDSGSMPEDILAMSETNPDGDGERLRVFKNVDPLKASSTAVA